MLRGRCNCGAISFEVRANWQGASNCDCSQCRKQSGHVWASAFAPVTDLHIRGEPRWYRSSGTAQRGFCSTCGAFLFWKHDAEDTISFALGALDGPTGLTLEKHIFVTDKGDYYDIADGVPQKD